MTEPNPVDYLKYVAAEGNALLNNAGNQLSAIDCDPGSEQTIERVQDILDAVRHMLTQATATFCVDGHDFDTYSDGRTVCTRLELETGNVYEHLWHPYPGHGINQPQTVLDRYECTSGTKRSVLVVTDQVLDSVEHGHGLRLVDDIADGDR
jgi:hypothetical protein